MTDKQTQTEADQSNMQKDPDRWVTGDEPMTGAQRSYFHTLAEEAGELVEDDLTKAEASKRIEDLQSRTGRGKPR
jgi:DNA topoisomerase VI subunit A